MDDTRSMPEGAFLLSPYWVESQEDFLVSLTLTRFNKCTLVPQNNAADTSNLTRHQTNTSNALGFYVSYITCILYKLEYTAVNFAKSFLHLSSSVWNASTAGNGETF